MWVVTFQFDLDPASQFDVDGNLQCDPDLAFQFNADGNFLV
jgi:hypothetical protein